MAERDEPGVPPLGRDATARHIRQIRTQLKRPRSHDPEGTPASDRGQHADVPDVTSTSGDAIDPCGDSSAPSNATLDLLEAELAALRRRIEQVEALLIQFRAGARDQDHE